MLAERTRDGVKLTTLPDRNGIGTTQVRLDAAQKVDWRGWGWG